MFNGDLPNPDDPKPESAVEDFVEVTPDAIIVRAKNKDGPII